MHVLQLAECQFIITGNISAAFSTPKLFHFVAWWNVESNFHSTNLWRRNHAEKKLCTTINSSEISNINQASAQNEWKPKRRKKVKTETKATAHHIVDLS